MRPKNTSVANSHTQKKEHKLPNPKFVLFIADKFSNENRSENDRFPGGAERTDDAAIEACPYPVLKCLWADLSETEIEKSHLIIVGNSGSAKKSQLNLLAKYKKHILFEHDLRICHWRGNFPASLEPIHRFSHRCICPHADQKNMFETALGIIYLTELQKSYYLRNPFFSSTRPHAILASSLFKKDFLEYAHNLSSKNKKTGTLIPGTKTKIKGSKNAEVRCKKEGWKFTKIINLTPPEVWEAMANAERFVYLPMGLEPAGRMPVEARLLGCKTVVNTHVGVAEDRLWKLDDNNFRKQISKQADFFWEIVRTFFPEF